MQLTHFLTAAFAASALAATFNGFSDTSCEKYGRTYVTVTAAQLKDLAVQQYPAADKIPQASGFLNTPIYKKKCPSNSDDTYKWVRFLVTLFVQIISVKVNERLLTLLLISSLTFLNGRKEAPGGLVAAELTAGPWLWYTIRRRTPTICASLWLAYKKMDMLVPASKVLYLSHLL